jgi:ketosteroid isomerase-like protein
MHTAQPTPTGTVRALLEAIDNRDLDSMDAVIADDVHFRFGNADPIDTQADFAATMHPFLRGIAEIRHEVIDMWEVHDGNVIATMDVRNLSNPLRPFRPRILC